MVFCGQCGYQLAPGNTVCPNCGAPVEPDLILDDPEPDNPTVASGLINAPTSAQPYVQRPSSSASPVQQEPLILGPGGRTYDPNQQVADATTSSMGAQTYGTPYAGSSFNPNTGASYPGYVPQNSGNYYPQSGAAYPGYVPPAGADYQYPSAADPYEELRAAAAARNRTGRLVGLMLILLGLLLIIGAMALYIFGSRSRAFIPSPEVQAVLFFAFLPLCRMRREHSSERGSFANTYAKFDKFEGSNYHHHYQSEAKTP